MNNAKTIIGFINTTLNGYALVFGKVSEERASKIILSILHGMCNNNPAVKEVLIYCREHYNFYESI